MRTLLIVDPQNDFISGTLKVPNAEEAMNNIINLINNNKFREIMVTLDWHPLAHCSFKQFGGKFPPHCIKHSSGAAIYSKLMDSLMDAFLSNSWISFWEKGEYTNVEEFSVFNEDYGPDLDLNDDDEIIVCGLAGDYCVLETIKDLIRLGFKKNIRVYLEGIASLDEGVKLNEYIGRTNLNILK